MSKTPGPGRDSIALPRKDINMASVRHEIPIAAAPDAVWDALRDWGALHTRLVPGFVTDTDVQGEDRVVTFFDGSVARERLIDLDEDRRRLVWSVVGGPLTHHNASARVGPGPQDGTAVVIWTADFLPHEAAPRMRALIAAGAQAMQRALGAAAARRSPRR
jgi:Polyketide cyclase / dehydrase and lipid transport